MHIIEQQIIALKRGEVFLCLKVARNVRCRLVAQLAHAANTGATQSLRRFLVSKALSGHKRQLFALNSGGYARCQQNTVFLLFLL